MFSATQEKKLWKGGPLVLQVIITVFALVDIFPLIWILMSSLKTNLEITGTNIIGLPQHWRWSNFSYVLTATNVGLALINSLIYSSLTVVFASLLAAMVAYAVTRMKWRFSKVTLALFMTGLMIPPHATLLPIFLMLKTTGLLNSYWALVIPYTVAALPTTIFILTGFFVMLPRELEEASVIDGCTIFQVFWQITIPLVKPALAAAAVFTFLATWNELMFATTFVNKPSMMPITVAINSLRGVHFSQYGAIFAGLVMAIFPAIAIYSVFSTQIQKSMIAGAVKG